MAKFPTFEEMAKRVAERALDEFLYDGRSIREWMQIIASEDCISRQAVIDKMKERDEKLECLTVKDVRDLPSVKPQEPNTEKVIKMRDATPEEREVQE